MNSQAKPLVYFDYCATTPLDPRVVQAMLPSLGDAFGNPSSMHWAGQQALELKEQARKKVATVLGGQPDEIIFTSGATEADNLALLGIMKKFAPADGHLITSAIEHHAVLHAAAELEKQGYAVSYLPVNRDGLVDLEVFQSSFRPETKLVSIMLVNNEVGSIQPIKELCTIAHDHGALFHTDAVQGLLLADHLIPHLDIDLLSLSAHKIYGPKGIGALWVRSGIEIHSQLFGGPQELGRRSGTENMPGILGLAAAIELLGENRERAFHHQSKLRKYLIDCLQKSIPETVVNGAPDHTAPHVISARFPGAVAEMMLFLLSKAGFAVSLGSACTSKDIEPSHVLIAMGQSPKDIESTLRISIGTPTTPDEIDALMDSLPEIYQQCKEVKGYA